MNVNSAPPPPPLDDDDTDYATDVTNPVNIVARSAAQQGTTIPAGWKQTPAKPIPVIKCTGTTSSGLPCTRWSIMGATVCIKHGAQLPSVQKAAAARVEATRLRMWGATPDAFEVLEALMLPGVAEGIRLKAATEILDRSGLKAGVEVAVTVEHTGSPLADILNQLEIIAGHAEPILEAEEIFDA